MNKTKTKAFCKGLIAFGLWMLCAGTHAQTFQVPTLANVTIPPAPDAAALGRYAEIPVGLYNGTAQVSIPIWTLQGRQLSVPVSLSYHASGIRVDDLASRVGLGWSLNAGGVITRTVHGLPDETAQGWLSIAQQVPTPTFPGAHSTFNAGYTNAELQLLMQIADGEKDSQPDAFFVNMPGYSGKIVFDNTGTPHPIPYQKLKITVDWPNRTWTITTTDGIRYTFGGVAIERTTTTSDCGQSQNQAFTSSWYLTEIRSPMGDVISLNYQSGGLLSYVLPVTETVYATKDPNGTAVCLNKAPDVCRGNFFTGIMRIAEITSSRGSVTFEYDSAPRQDIAGDRRLASITVRDRGGSTIRTFALSHSYFSGRLMLDSVQETGTNNTANGPTVLQYYTDKSLPPRGSYNQDHWGFANGANNTTLIPRTELPDCRILGSADRRANLAYSRAASLRQMTYPAGGSSRFDYELHTYDPGPAGSVQQDVQAQAKAWCTGGPCGSPACTGCQGSETVSFIIDQVQCVQVDLLLDHPDRANGICDGEVRLRKQNGPVINIWNCNSQSATQSYDVKLWPGTYALEAKAFLRDDFVSARVHFSKTVPNRQQHAGGLRIARITDHDNFDSANDIVREFRYDESGQANVSGGALVKTPRYLFDYTEERALNSGGTAGFYTNCLFFAASGSSILPLGSTQGGHVGYGEVQTLHGSGGSNGSVTSYFVSPKDVADGQFEYPYGPVTSQDHRRGLLTRSVTQTATGKMVAETLNEYQDGSASPISTEIPALLVAYYRRSTTFPGSIQANHLFVRSYAHLSQWAYPTRTIERTYDENGIDYMEKVTTSDYGNPAHTQLTATRTIDSHGRELIQRFRYPADFAAGTGDVHASATTRLHADQFRHDVVVEQTLSQKKPNQNEEVLGGALTKYKEFGPGLILPEEMWVLETNQGLSNFSPASISGTFQQDSRYVLREIAERYDAKGNLLQMLQKDGIRATFKWGYGQSLPIASILNGTTATDTDPIDCSTAFVGFEDFSETQNNPDEDFWIFNTANSHNGNAHTGRWCRRIRPGSAQHGPERELRPDDQNGTYIFSAWVKTSGNYSGGKLIFHTKKDNPSSAVFPNPQLFPAQVITTIPATNNRWQYFEARLDLGALRQLANIPAFMPLRLRVSIENNDPANPLRVDDLRVQEQDARMQTFTFHPQLGRTSEMDVNNISRHYEYDGLGRLALVRDQDRKIVKRHQYHLKPLGQATHNRVLTDVLQVPRSQAAAIDQLAIGKRYRSVVYGDGFGRQLQKIDVQAAPDKSDMVAFSDFDPFGRTPKLWLPYTRALNAGNFVQNPEAEQAAFYQGTPRVAQSAFPFSETRFEASPLVRPLERSAAGNAWQMGKGHTIETGYIVNTASHPVRKWVVAGANATAQTIYDVGELVGIHTLDEDEGETYEFRDKLDRLVYKKVKHLEGNAKQGGIVTTWLETYFVYDDFGNFAFVIPPKAVAQLNGGGVYDLSTLSEDLVFRYQYDGRQRQVVKKTPGKEAEELVYDNLDRVILTRDGNHRAQNRWRFTKYDRLGRPATSGIFDNNTFPTRQAMQTLVNGVLANQLYQNHEKRTGTNFAAQLGYTDQSFPNPAASSGTYEILQANYYDHYDFDLDGQDDVSYLSDPDGQIPDQAFYRVRDRATGTRAAILNRSSLSAAVNWTESSNFFDQYGREIQAHTTNHLGARDLIFSEFDFGGKVKRTKVFHRHNTPEQIRVAKRYTYDHAGRVTKVHQQNNTDTEVLLRKNEYNAVGELVEKNVHKLPGGRFWQSVDYRYHIRGWLRSINTCDLDNDFRQSQKTWYLQSMTATVIEQEDRLGRSTLYLDVELTKADQPGPPNAPGMKVLTETVQVPLMPEDTSNLANVQLKALLQQAVTIDFPFMALTAGAAIASAEQRTAVSYDSTLVALAVTDSLACTKAVQAACSVVLKQAQATYDNDDGNDLFGMELSYETGNVQLQGDPVHTGNISAVCWSSRFDRVKRGYGFRYDAVGRLTQAHFAAIQPGGKKWDSEIGHYSVPDIEYDPNGNILQLTRNGWQSGNTFGMIDDLRYRYDGNRLQAVQEQSFATGFHDFQDNGATTNTDYTYDANGNLIADANKGMTVSYNHLNLPEVVDFGGGNRVEFLYNAAGKKLTQLVVNAASSDLRKDYVNGFVYAGGDLEFFATDEGRAVPDTTGPADFRHECFYTDHLGNLRLGYSDLDRDGKVDVTEIIQENHYYPFGMTFGGLGSVQLGVAHKFQFNGKELSDAHGLHWLDYGARFYDPQLGRWHAVDPLAGETPAYSPYAYVLDNPIIHIDPTGESADIVLKGRNNSSLTIKTDLVDQEIEVDDDFGGNHEVDFNEAKDYVFDPKEGFIGPKWAFGFQATGKDDIFLGIAAGEGGKTYGYVGFTHPDLRTFGAAYEGTEGAGGIGLGIGMSISGGLGGFVGRYIGTSNDPIDLVNSFVGAYNYVSIALEPKVFLGVEVNLTVTYSEDWVTVGLTAGGSFGIAISAGKVVFGAGESNYFYKSFDPYSFRKARWPDEWKSRFKNEILNMSR